MEYKFRLLEEIKPSLTKPYNGMLIHCPGCGSALKSCSELNRNDFIFQCPCCHSFLHSGRVLDYDEALDLLPEDAEYLP